MKFILALAATLSMVPTVLGACCDLATTCGDGTRGTPCCATGKCNIFCCACKGHCRKKRWDEVPDALLSKREFEDTFAAADVGGKGYMSLADYLNYMGATADKEPKMWVDWFLRHDVNGDGVVTQDEVTLAVEA